jgi:hypothetical protein
LIGPLNRVCRWLVPVLMVWVSAATLAVAQEVDPRPATPRDALEQAGVAVGDAVSVRDARGDTITGRLAAATDVAVEVRAGAGLRRVAAVDVRRIEWRKPDPPFRGILIGAALGSIPGLYWLAADPNECRGLCPEEYAFIGIGAVVGGLIDRAIRKQVTVYSAASRAEAAPISVRARLAPDRHGLAIVIRF